MPRRGFGDLSYIPFANKEALSVMPRPSGHLLHNHEGDLRRDTRSLGMTNIGIFKLIGYGSLKKRTYTKGFTLLELLIVLALIGFVYAVAMPSLTMRTGTQVANALGRLGDDIRSVFDLAILTNMPHRM